MRYWGVWVLLAQAVYAGPVLRFSHSQIDGNSEGTVVLGSKGELIFRIENIGDQDTAGGKLKAISVLGPGKFSTAEVALPSLAAGETLDFQDSAFQLELTEVNHTEPFVIGILEWSLDEGVSGEYAFLFDILRADLTVKDYDFGQEVGIKPGESGNLYLWFKNTGSEKIQNAILSPSPVACVSQVSGQLEIDQLEVGEVKRIDSPLQVEIDPGCVDGDLVKIGLSGKYESQILEVTLETEAGFRAGLIRRRNVSLSGLNLPCPDYQTVIQKISFPYKGSIIDLGIDIDLKHTYISDLNIKLRHPGGQEVTLHNHTGGSSHDIKQRYGMDGMAIADLSKFIGLEASGDWELVIYDYTSPDPGVLQAVNLEIEGYLN